MTSYWVTGHAEFTTAFSIETGVLFWSVCQFVNSALSYPYNAKYKLVQKKGNFVNSILLKKDNSVIFNECELWSA